VASIFEESAVERARRYLQLADRMRDRAERLTEPELKLAYFRMAQSWEELAFEAERQGHPLWAVPESLELRAAG